MILIREFYLEDGHQVYSGRDTVMPTTNRDWVDCVESWADQNLEGWTDIECFEITSTNYCIQR